MDVLIKRWYLLAIACVINLCAGSIYAWSVFAGPKAEQLSQILGQTITAGDLSLAFSLGNGLAPIPMLLLDTHLAFCYCCCLFQQVCGFYY